VTRAGDETVSAAGDPIVTVDDTGTITSWNPAAERLFGHTETEAVGQTLVLIIPPEHRPRHVAAFHQAMDTGWQRPSGTWSRPERSGHGGGGPRPGAIASQERRGRS
jgi:PAS domain S-box-containing protein